MIIDKARATIEKYHMLRKNDKVLVGLSGGPDSVTLLYILNSIKKDYILRIYAAHLDHKIRGDESAKDRSFCEKLAGELNIDIICGEIDVARISAEKGLSLEEAARIERYDFFRKVAGEKGIKKIAVGHNMDDQAETVLMRLVRGSGIKGLGGMSPVRNMDEVTIIRPLIEVSRKEIEGFVKDSGLLFRHDSSNDKVIFTRNRIRHELIPYLERNFNPNIKEILANMSENFRAENEFLEKFSGRKFRGLSRREKKDSISIDIRKFKSQPEAIRKRIFREALSELKGDLRRLTYQHWKEMDELIYARPDNSVVDLPGTLKIMKKKNSLVLSC